jgi:hypothetical protein
MVFALHAPGSIKGVLGPKRLCRENFHSRQSASDPVASKSMIFENKSHMARPLRTIKQGTIGLNRHWDAAHLAFQEEPEGGSPQ